EQPRYADGEAGRRHRLAAEARHEAIIAAAAADRSEAHRLAVVAGDHQRQFDLVDRTGVVFEAAHDGRIDLNSVVISCGRYYFLHHPKFCNTLAKYLTRPILRPFHSG